MKQEKVLFDQELKGVEEVVNSQMVQLKTDISSREREIKNYKKQIADLEKELSEVSDQHLSEKQTLNDQFESEKNGLELIIKRQTSNINKLVDVGKGLKDKLKIKEAMWEQKLDRRVDSEAYEDLQFELKELKKYTDVIETRFQDIQSQETAANRKILSLLDEIEVLTKENHELIG